MEISATAAGLLAQIVPVGLLVLVVELRAARVVADRMRGKRKVRVDWFVKAFPYVLAFVVFVAVAAVAVCTTAVITNDPIEPVVGWSVVAACYLLYGFAGAVIVVLAFITGHHSMGRNLTGV
ncbi:hypothetical protein [Microbacterium sp. E-13]|uniref:hypothetical protein n=1 Tax=Microbacterium sp. E-13 TaxID=3404048 RepID=UPI003CE82BDB